MIGIDREMLPFLRDQAKSFGKYIKVPSKDILLILDMMEEIADELDSLHARNRVLKQRIASQRRDGYRRCR